jgi:hypothetical protein
MHEKMNHVPCSSPLSQINTCSVLDYKVLLVIELLVWSYECLIEIDGDDNALAVIWENVKKLKCKIYSLVYFNTQILPRAKL